MWTWQMILRAEVKAQVGVQRSVRLKHNGREAQRRELRD